MTDSKAPAAGPTLHTPGPWSAEGGEVWSGVDAADLFVADTFCDESVPVDTALANAKLIAAAPALADALDCLIY